MTVERSQNVFGFDVHLRVEVPEVARLEPALAVRLEHHVGLALNRVAQRLVKHVIEWPVRQKVLKRMSAGDAQTLGLMREWKQAHEEERP